MSNVPLPEPHHQSAANFNAPDEPFYTADQMHAHAAAVSAAKDAEIAGLRAELFAHQVYIRVLCKAVDAATDFAGTVAGGASWWDDVWAEHFRALDAARAELIKSLADNAALRADAIDRQNNVVAPLRERVRELTTQAMFNASTIERLRAEVAGLREWLEADARCPCCDTVDACLDDCTFATDCPQDAGRMAEVRALLAARKGEA